MFEKLIESEIDQTAKGRRKYFVASSVVVGLLFITAVVLSIYAGDYGLGKFDIEIADLTAPIETTSEKPEPIKQQKKSDDVVAADKTVRTSNVVESIANPTKVPDGVSTSQNTAPVAPKGSFEIGQINRDAGAADGTGRDNTVGDNTGIDSITDETETNKVTKIEPPPPLVTKSRPSVTRSKGVINGEAKYLPIPVYSQIARAAGANGRVHVQVTVDETGKVIAANAVEGHIMLRQAAEQAARKARFSPTILSDTPVKVTGVIIYNFTK